MGTVEVGSGALPEWVHPESGATIETHRVIEGWQVVVRWQDYGLPAGPAPDGPSEVVIRPATPTAELVRHGVTPGLVRSLATVINQMWQEMTEPQQATKWRQHLRREAAQLPARGTRDPAYYPALLRLFEMIDATSAEPVNELADAMGIPKNTLKSRLRLARDRQASHS